ncbi:hypothetical protein [Thiopseudomonas denitrificans]|uniref:Uncharacterized protein n=1 Tax=Thiopseudomonas denitrificans TaxID=1501432 RepID=A0A4V3D5B1_9GAMM|nr:hypothetical protein [Thiopseudomonas denitrificans]TDQ39367.1 hypothetical protein DFQ45_10258 [Thiopseudomonas denitrificans]
MWHLIAVFISGLSMGGLAYLARKLSRNRLPSWIIPVAAGVSMFGYLAVYDYTWYGYKTEQVRITQPSDDLVFFGEKQERSFFKPWSVIRPAINSFFIFDGNSKTVEQDNQVIVEYFLYEFIKDPIERQQVYMAVLNCTTLERAVIPQGKTVKAAQHEKIDTSDLFYQKLCR